MDFDNINSFWQEALEESWELAEEMLRELEEE